MNDQYFLQTGEIDRERLTIVSQHYNPPALSFLKDNGLQPEMTILEVGCGTGHMACDLAKFIGPKGKVIAIDSSSEQIEIAKKTAEQAGVSNIDFHVCDVFELDKLAVSYDATYGRWVIEFTKNPEKALELIYKNLKPGGLLCYEASNIEQKGAFFSYPYNPCIEEWHDYRPKMFASYGAAMLFADNVFSIYKKLNCQHIKMRASQAILTTAHDKSVYRLGVLTSSPSLLAANIMTESEINGLIEKLIAFEESESLSGFYRNYLIAAVK